MSVTEADIRQKVTQWLEYADEDFRLAKHGFTLATGTPYRLITYHAQQCAEKHLKAFLVHHMIDFPYTHSISRLLELCSTKAPWAAGLESTEVLTTYATTARYPGEAETVSEAEARRAVELAEKVREAVRRALRIEGDEGT